MDPRLWDALALALTLALALALALALTFGKASIMLRHPTSKFHDPYFLFGILVVSYVLSCAEYLL